MTTRTIQMTKADYDRLTELIRSRNGSTFDAPRLRELQREVESAEVVDSREIPPDVVTMNSTVRLRDLRSRDEVTYTLTYPADANLDENKISVLAPIGTAIFGYRTGDTVEWPVPAGLRRLRIEAIVYQPEAAGDFHR